MIDQPRILIFTGDGKGKTTAALGLALRAAGHGMQVLVIQFVKQDSEVGEIAAVESINNIKIVQTGLGFIPSQETPDFLTHCKAAQAGLALAVGEIVSGIYDMVILDEICVAVARDLISESKVLNLLSELPDEIRIVMTGRGATPGLVNAADTVSEICSVKHALADGRPAMKGVER